MGFLNDAIAWLLALYYQFIPSYGVAIILLTLTVMIVLTPLTLKGTKSMMAMQRLQPEMKRIQNQYRGDRERMNEELLKFYKENDINPLGGCLPLVAQMPVFIVLYSVLRGLTRRTPDLGMASGWAEGLTSQGKNLVQMPDIERAFDPAYVKQGSDLYHSLADATQMKFLGMDLALSPSQALSQNGVLAFLPYLGLIAVVAWSGWYQQRQIQGRSQTQVSSQQQMIAKIMPVMLPVISFTLPAGLVLYFAVSNLWRVGQQWWITRTFFKEGGGPIDVSVVEDEPAASSRRATEKKGRATPRRDGSMAEEPKQGFFSSLLGGGAAEPASTSKDSSKASGKSGNPRKAKGSDGGRAASSKSKSSSGKSSGKGSSKGKAKRRYTSDPKAKKGEAKVEPRGRKGKRN